MKTLAVISQKGGTGKTTTCIAAGSWLLNKGKRVLFIDADGQKNLSFTMAASSEGVTLYDVLKGLPAERAIIKAEQGDIISASEKLSLSIWNETEIANSHRHKKDLRKSLKTALEGIAAEYDYCIIDTPPAVNETTVNVLYAADYVIIPLKADRFSVKALQAMKATLDVIREENKNLKVAAVIVTSYNKRSILHQQMLEMLQEEAEELETEVFTVRQSIALAEAEALQDINIFRYAPKVSAVLDYSQIFETLAKEI